MNKTFIIIEREFTTRVKKKSFIIFTIFVPILMVLFYAFLIWMMVKDDTQERVIAVINESGIENPIQDINNTHFVVLDTVFNTEQAGTYLMQSGNYAVMWIPSDIETKPELPIYSFQQVPLDLRNTIAGQLRAKIEDKKRQEVIALAGVPDLEQRLKATSTPVTVRTLKVSEEGSAKESSSEMASFVGLAGGMVIYIFILMYSTQVMKGVIEEKSNRIIEVLVSSVKPFQFLLGKIIGVASVGLLQFIIWIIIGFIGIAFMQGIFMSEGDLEAIRSAGSSMAGMNMNGINMEQLGVIGKIASTIDLAFIAKFLAAFLFYFLGGYLLYASLFAAIGAAVDNETDSQQFMTPLSIVLIIGVYIGFAAMKSPESPLVFWSSLFPFTSPIVMLVRIPFGVPVWEVVVSMVLLVASFIFFTWVSGKIYRIGILMYGKKVTWKELWKWLKY